MNVYPQDFGKRFEGEILDQRVPEPGKQPIVSTRISAVVFFVSLAGTIIAGLLQWPIGLPLLFVAVIAASLYIHSALGSYGQEQRASPVTEYEIGLLRDSVQDPLARDYLALVKMVLSVPTPSGVAAEREVRGAVQALGVAIESLPLQGREIITEDPRGLQAEADRLGLETQSEPDPVIRASRQRRSDSLTRRAGTAARTVMLLRRNQALREEVTEQINALRTNLTAFSIGGEQSVQELASLAVSIQSVTIEANAITAARAEIDTLLSSPAAQTVTGDETQPLGRGR